MRIGPDQPRHSYALLFALLVVTVGFAIGSSETALERVVLVMLLSAALVLAAWTSGAPQRVQRLALAISALALLGAIGLAVSGNGGVGEMSLLSSLVVLLTPAVMARGLVRALREQGVTPQVVFGAMALYLMLGIFFASVYGVVAKYGDTSLFAPPNGDGTVTDHYYFAFTTQTTVGYGDFSPLDDIARAAAMLQALAGQLYLVTVLALLVGNLGRGPRRA
jgi:hypothetical protein